MIVKLSSPAEARAWCGGARASGVSLGFVPTMGALHEGHLDLVQRSLAENDRTCVSVFVNPLQFNEQRDFERYPRDFDGDAQILEKIGVPMVFTGTLAAFFPRELKPDGTLDPAHLRDPGAGASGLEGEHRPGHFAGVATIVERLFDVVRPSRAYFGQKDYQQTLVVRDLARCLGAPEVVVCPTSRERSGLARSSRNALLSAEDREHAVSLSRGLKAARASWRAGERDAERLRAALRTELHAPHVAVEYAALRDPLKWTREDPKGPMSRAIALVAARVGGVRLIDNMWLSDHTEDGARGRRSRAANEG